ncbi:MAG: hypothetical protein MJY91_00665 [Bacteroidales bacterium]|nr:hypothetical protein [Bacteroidales bacterium]
MAKGKHRWLKALLIVPGTIVGLFLVLQTVLNSRIVDKVVDRYAAQFVDGTLDYSDVKVSLIRNFPAVRLRIDSLSLTYPHDRFAAWDSLGVRSLLREAGRGEQADTLARIGRFSVAMNPWPLIHGKVRVKYVGIRGLRAFARVYDDSTANWNMFNFGGAEKDTVSSGGIPQISLGALRIGDHPRIVYTNQQDTVYAMLGLKSLRLGGSVAMEDGSLKLRRASFDMDSLKVVGRLPADTLLARIDFLNLHEKGTDLYDILLGARAVARTGNYGRLELPLDLDGRVRLSKFPDVISLDVQKLLANVAHIPFSLAGQAEIRPDSLYVDASMKVDNCPLDTLLADYARAFTPIADDIVTTAHLDMDISAQGFLTPTQVPEMEACVRIPDGHVYYRPLDLGATLNVDVDASMSPQKVLDAQIDKFLARTRGLKLSLSGAARNLLCGNPRIKARAKGFAKLDSLTHLLPENSGVEGDGEVDIELEADALLSQLNQYKFEDSVLSGKIVSDRIFFRMPADSVDIQAYNPYVDISSSKRGIELKADVDSARVALGTDTRARVRGMRNTGYLHKVENRFGKLVPRLEVTSDEDRIFFRTGNTRIAAMKTSIAASVQKIAMPDRKALSDAARAHRMDSLRRANPGMFMSPTVREKDFAKADISIALDSSLTNYLKQWKPYARIGVRRASVMTPALPLRTRVRGLYGSFDGDRLMLDTLAVKCGSSDVVARGSVSGLRRSLIGKGWLKANLDIHSKKLNLNEIIAALQIAQSNQVDTTTRGEEDESFIIDTLADVIPDSTRMALIVVPGNVDASLKVHADEINYTDILITPGTATVNLKDRVLQLADTRLVTNLGNIDLDAFYSTQTKKDITAGADLRLSDVSAEGIIHMLPSVDSLMPALKSFQGKLNCDVTATTRLDTCMNILMPTLNGVVRIQGKNLRIDDVGDLRRITKLLVFKNKNIGDIDDLYVNAVVHDSRLEVYPFILGVDRYQLALYGVQGFDKSMNYQVSILRSPFLIRFGIKMYGKLDDWHFGLTRPQYRNGTVPAFSQELDSLQINLGTSIRDIYRHGIEGVQRYNKNSMEQLERRKEEMNYDPAAPAEDLSAEDSGRLQAALKEEEETKNAQ